MVDVSTNYWYDIIHSLKKIEREAKRLRKMMESTEVKPNE